MTKTLSFFFVSLLLISCGKGGGGGSSSSDPAAKVTDSSIALEEIAIDKEVPTAAQNFEVNIDMHNFDSKQEDKILEASDLIRKVISSDEFKNKVLNHKVNGKKTFVDNGGLTNAEIYKKIIEGSEMLNPTPNNTMDLELEVYVESTNTVGYTYPNTERVWMNEKYLNARNAAKVTTNMMHEWLHKVGFKHEVNATPSRASSVPYAIGYIVAELASKIN